MNIKNKYHYIYSQELANILIDNGEQLIVTAYAKSTQNQFWLFEKTELSEKIVSKYSELRSEIKSMVSGL